MAVVSFRINEGSRTTARTVQGVSGGSLSGFIRINTALITPSPGDIVEIFTGALSGNAAFYNLTNFSGGTGGLGLYVRPAPNQQLTAGGSIARLNRAPQRIPQAGVAISAVMALSGSDQLAVVHAPGANFLASGVRPNDRAAISGSSISGNMGGWYVHEVLTEDLVVLRPPDRGPGMTAEFPGTGTITVRQGIHTVLTIPSEDEVLGWARTWGVSGILPAQGNLSGYQGSGELRNYVRVTSGVGQDGARDYVQILGLSDFLLALSGLSGVTWPAQDEAVTAPPIPTTTGAIRGLRIATSGTAPPRPLVVALGSPVFIDGSPASGAVDQYSVISGSSWVGVSIPGNNVTFQFHGSYWDPQDGLVVQALSGTSGVASVYRGNSVNPLTGWFSESFISYGGFGIVPQGAPTIANLLIPSTSALGSASTAGAVLEGLILGGAVAQPMMATVFTSGDPLVILNPRIDLDIYTYFYLFFAGGSIEKQYTYNPRFRSADGGSPISGLTVEIYEVSDIDGESLLLSETTDENGRIGGGVGYNLRTQRIDGAAGYQLGTLTSYTYRVVTQGGGYTLVSRDYEFVEKFVQDVTVPHIAPDYEGGFSE